MIPVAAVALLLLYNLIILGTTAYAVFWLGYSGWWFLLAILLCCGSGSASEEKKE